MAISQDGFPFPHYHGTIRRGPWRYERQATGYPGLEGMTHLRGKRQERQLWCEYHLTEYVSAALLQDALDQIESQVNELTGPITVTGNAAPSGPIRNCTFDGFEMGVSGIQYDAGGGNGWHCKGRLMWTQRSP